MRLVSRDRAILVEAFLSRVVRRDDLISLGHFTSVCRCNARLLALLQAGLLTVREHLSGVRLRSSMYLPTKQGVRIAAEALGISQAEALSAHKGSIRDLTLRHSLRCNDLRLRFVQDLTAKGAPRLEKWSHELLCHHEFIDGSGRTTVVKPDALATLQWQAQAHCVFIEVDLGNASLPKFRDKIDRYLRYARTGAFEQVYGARSFNVLTVTTDERRLASLVRTVPFKGLLFTTWKRLEGLSLLGEAFTVNGCSKMTLGVCLSGGRQV